MKQPYVGTYSGRKVHFLDPQACEIDIGDIAHALSMQCRFNGHVSRHTAARRAILLHAVLLPGNVRKSV